MFDMQASSGATSKKERLYNLVTEPGWLDLLETSKFASKIIRRQLLTTRDLDQDTRQYYIGQMAGVYNLIKSVYATSGVELPQSIKIYFTEED